jgi:undecaprenyl-diphosphatase
MPPIDSTIFLWINASSASPQWMIKLALFASQQLPGLVVAGAIGAFMVAEADVRRRVLRVLLAMAVAWVSARVAQHLIPMPRPFSLGLGTQWLAHGNSAGFPSTHASVAFAFAAAVALNSKRWAIGVAAFALASVIAWSRICLGLHFPSDVLAGLVVGLICATISSWVIRQAPIAHSAQGRMR